MVPDIADVRTLSLEAGRRFSTKVAGLFLFLPMLLELDLPAAVIAAGLPGSEAIPPLQALLAILTPKLLGKRRVSHISDLCYDEGAGLFAGLNVLPKTTFATDYSYKTGAHHDRAAGRRPDRRRPPRETRPWASTSTSTRSRSAAPSPTWRTTGWPCGTGPSPR